MLLTSQLAELNELQAIAASFATGVADEELGFSIIGRSFCSSVEFQYDIISAVRTEGAHPHWQAIVDVYTVWRPRLTRAELEKSKNALDKQIQDLSSTSDLGQYQRI